MRSTTKSAVVTLGALGMVLPLSVGSTASAAADDDDRPRTKRTECSGPSFSVLRVPGDDGGRVSYTVNTPRPGQVWTFSVREDDDRLISGRRTTDARGDFTVSRYSDDDDRVVATARNTRTGETCRVALGDD